MKYTWEIEDVKTDMFVFRNKDGKAPKTKNDYLSLDLFYLAYAYDATGHFQCQLVCLRDGLSWERTTMEHMKDLLNQMSCAPASKRHVLNFMKYKVIN